MESKKDTLQKEYEKQLQMVLKQHGLATDPIFSDTPDPKRPELLTKLPSDLLDATTWESKFCSSYVWYR